MAVRDTSKKPYLQDEDDKIKIGLDLKVFAKRIDYLIIPKWILRMH